MKRCPRFRLRALLRFRLRARFWTSSEQALLRAWLQEAWELFLMDCL